MIRSKNKSGDYIERHNTTTFITVHIKTNVSKLTEQNTSPSQQFERNASVNEPYENGVTNSRRMKLARSFFNITNIEPQTEFFDDVPKHMEGNKEGDRSIFHHQHRQHLKDGSEIFNEKNDSKVRPGTPLKIREMFEKISPRIMLAKHLCILQEDLSLKNGSTEMSFSDSDSDILDDNDFEIRSQGRYQNKSVCSSQSNKKDTPGEYILLRVLG